MIFKNFSRKFVEKSWVELVNDLAVGLKSLSFVENFSCQRIDGIRFEPGQEVQIPHNLKVLPSDRIITRQQGEAIIFDGANAWTADSIYLRNPSATETVTISIIIFK